MRKQRIKLLGKTVLIAVLVFAGLGCYWQFWEWQHERIGQLEYAALLGDTRTVNFLLDAGVSPDARNFHRRSALESAAYKGHQETVRILVERGANPNGGLRFAAQEGHADVLELLLAKRAKIQGEEGASVLGHAVQSGSLAAVNLLLRHGADINARDDSGEPAILHAASSRGSWEMFQTLEGQGADINARSSYGETTLMFAAAGSSADSLRICEYLIRHGVDVNVTDDEGRTALIWSVYFQRGDEPHNTSTLAILETLLRNGADVNARDKSGKSALRYATEYQNGKAKTLLKQWHAEF